MQIPPCSGSPSNLAATFAPSPNVVIVVNDVAQIDADAERDAPALRNAGIALGQAPLNLHGTAHRIHYACKLHQHPIAGGFHDVAAMLLDLGINQRAAVRLQLGERAFLVCVHEPDVAGNICGQDRCQPALGVRLFHGVFPPGPLINRHSSDEGPSQCQSRPFGFRSQPKSPEGNGR
jgi:hypothetical protein